MSVLTEAAAAVWIMAPVETRRSLLPVLLSLILLQLVVTATQEGAWHDHTHGRPGSELHDQTSCCSWKRLVFTLQWPGGFCQSLDNETLCRIPPSANNWTIHGLWTDEWRKHGVCAACVEGMNSPQKYFQICLKLRGRFDVHKMLEDAGITPSCERPYKVPEVHSVLAPHLGNKHEIQCVTDDKDREVWFQVKIPLTRNLTVGCDHRGGGDIDGDPAAGSIPGRSFSPGHPCPPQVPFYYFPIDHQRPRRPCG
ncbi:ribonuclease T2-like isoform X2 [Scophthalmus maximus]|uniref:ribonuclease T2-like isoform X2 n=1 Tax=Scophthalmus maximus TaxID=52904 RepID=UPI0015E10FFB|nr:ribonuclease T2-like isoform X2 [Scophthalmus maximus]